MVAPAILTIPVELSASLIPVAAAFPPPKTWLVILEPLSMSRLVFPFTIAVVPFPPA